MTFAILLDLLMCGLLAATVVYAVLLHRRLTSWRQDKGELEEMVKRFNAAAKHAETATAALKQASEECGRPVAELLAKAESLRSDLSYLLERAEPAADRLAELVRPRRGGAIRAVAGGAAAEGAPEPRTTAERELAKALAALR